METVRNILIKSGTDKLDLISRYSWLTLKLLVYPDILGLSWYSIGVSLYYWLILIFLVYPDILDLP